MAQVLAIVEVKVKKGTGAFKEQDLKLPDYFRNDTKFKPVPMKIPPHKQKNAIRQNEETIVIRGTVEEDKIKELGDHENVLKLWLNMPCSNQLQCCGPTQLLIPQCNIFDPARFCPPGFTGEEGMPEFNPLQLFSGVDWFWWIPKGTIYNVANFLQADLMWSSGFRGENIVVGIVDGGITAQGRVPWIYGTIPNVIGGWPEDTWGTRAYWGKHANMSSFDVLGMAPCAKIYDIRIPAEFHNSPFKLSTEDIYNAFQGYQWALEQYRKDGTPQILSNSWGLTQKAVNPEYATDPDHFFTRKAAELVEEGIILVFAAGNCGSLFPVSYCGHSIGPGNDIWGANGDPRVMTVGAANIYSQYVSYSSVGPAALDSKKPDFCGASNFLGYSGHIGIAFPDVGTTTSCPTVSGVTALLKQAEPGLTPAEIKTGLQNTARQIWGASGWNNYTGHGVVQVKAALESFRC
ncbi:MAG: S8 family peptidase [Desulfobacteraceae bacterium]|nr:S8 family peptidase [Desulfobacteraceae bacterium]